jgi:hypothetical protein
MRKLYDETGGQLQRWESLGNLGAVASDARGIACPPSRANRAPTDGLPDWLPPNTCALL